MSTIESLHFLSLECLDVIDDGLDFGHDVEDARLECVVHGIWVMLLYFAHRAGEPIDKVISIAKSRVDIGDIS